jgi:hypothetical protein
MKLAFTESINLRRLIALLTAGLLLATVAVGCGDDDDDDDGGSDASVSTGGKGGGGGKGGSTAGKGGGGGAAGSTAKITAAECEKSVEKQVGSVSDEAKCMCAKCTDTFGACAADAKCFAVITCGEKNNCADQACYTSKCATELGALTSYTALTGISSCADADKCSEAADSGT